MNRLGQERSPYLLQHAGNPVDWYPWGQEAFERARREEKPIFLSIGYSTCHWCHVMEHESFENPDIAALLNRDFVSIKVDREERPDVDRVYMSFVQATTGSGGWPMTVFLTPELKPFFGGTYFPPSSRWGRPGFADFSGSSRGCGKRIGSASRAPPPSCCSDSAGSPARTAATAPEAECAAAALDTAVEQFRAAFDAAAAVSAMRRSSRGLPSCSSCCASTHGARAGATPDALEMATATLRAMALGGMRDHIGGGFHRYSVDGDWRVPHFEKMLYDQAQLVLAYLEAAQATGEAFYADVAEDTLDYVRRDMTDPGGGFYSAEDADSLPPEKAGVPGAHKSEGAFYIWSDEEIGALLGADADIARLRFGIGRPATRRSDPQGEFTGRNLLYTAQSIDEVAAATGRTAEEVGAALERIRETLFEQRVSASAAASRRQGADGLERPDDRGICPRRARSRQTGRPPARISMPRSGGRAFVRRHALGRRSAAAPIPGRRTPPSTATPRTTPIWSWACSNCSRPAAIRSGSTGRSGCRRSRTNCSGTTTRAAGSAPPARIRQCCSG